MPEVWRDVVGFEGRYEVSNRGRVRNAQTKHVKSQVCLHDGYCGVGLKVKTDSGYQTRVRSVHGLVARAFLGEAPAAHEINHKDLNKCNNDVRNLEYVTQYRNREHAHEHGFNTLDKPTLRSDGVLFPSIGMAARASGCTNKDIRNVLCGRQRTTHGYSFALA